VLGQPAVSVLLRHANSCLGVRMLIASQATSAAAAG
jgi:hypothetical protein